VLAGKDRIIAITHEITERKERVAALERSENRLRATIEAALDCVISMDAKGDIIEFNPAAQTRFGYTRCEALGTLLVDLIIPKRYREAHRAGLRRYCKTGEGPFLGRRVEVYAMRADGTAFPAELAIVVARGAKGAIFTGYLRDITE
jgi:PAS domain S-box-containing protein